MNGSSFSPENLIYSKAKVEKMSCLNRVFTVPPERFPPESRIHGF